MPFQRRTTILARLCSFFPVIAIALIAHASSKASPPENEAIGHWKITSVLDNVEITSIDDEQAKQLLGRVMDIRKERALVMGEDCGKPSLETERVEPNIYVWREAKISAKKLNLPSPVTVVDIGCTRVFIKQFDQAVIFWDGFFFGVTRTPQPKISRR